MLSPADLEILPINKAQTLPAQWYTDEKFFHLDQQAVVGCTWQYIGPSAKVAQPGDYMVGDVAGRPCLVVRGQDKVLRAFANVCRHRAGPLATCDGHAKFLQCKYHGWTYNLTGKLMGAPKFQQAEDFDLKSISLPQMAVDEWEGLVFINLSPEHLPLATTMAGICERLAPHTPSTLKYHSRVTYDVHCNWKIYIDNFLEGYHVPFVHPGLNDALDTKNYRTEISEHYSLQSTPLAGDSAYGKGGGNAYYYFVLPNFMLNITPGRLQVNVVVPKSSNLTQVIFDYYYADQPDGAFAARAKEDQDFADVVQKEDIEICELVHRGLTSSTYDKGRICPEEEVALHHFQAFVKSSYQKHATRS